MDNCKVVHLGTSNYEDIVLNSGKVVVIDFWATWCAPCRAIAPVMEELADEFDGKAIIAKVNIDEEGDLRDKFRIMSIPTIMVFKNGEMVDRVVGAKPKMDFVNIINKHL